MARPGTGFPQWAMVDEGWGRNPECDVRVGDMHALPWDGLPLRAELNVVGYLARKP